MWRPGPKDPEMSPWNHLGSEVCEGIRPGNRNEDMSRDHTSMTWMTSMIMEIDVNKLIRIYIRCIEVFPNFQKLQKIAGRSWPLWPCIGGFGACALCSQHLDFGQSHLGGSWQIWMCKNSQSPCAMSILLRILRPWDAFARQSCSGGWLRESQRRTTKRTVCGGQGGSPHSEISSRMSWCASSWADNPSLQHVWNFMKFVVWLGVSEDGVLRGVAAKHGVDSDRPKESRGNKLIQGPALTFHWSAWCWILDSISREVVRGIPQNALIGVQLEHLLLQALLSGSLCHDMPWNIWRFPEMGVPQNGWFLVS